MLCSPPDHIRKAKPGDASRLAEILVFSKRTHYRKVFQDDDFSFGELQVFPIARNFLEQKGALHGYYVYDDGFVKGLIHLEGDEIAELYVDPFFENMRIGTALMDFALKKILHPQLWVLEGNDQAVAFYEKMGFSFTGKRKFVTGTDKYEAHMRHTAPVENILGKIVHVTVDRPLGSTHPDHPDMIYPVNYGYAEGIPGGDGEDQDVYILGITQPVSEFTGPVIAVIHREDDTEDKWVSAPESMNFTPAEIRKQTAFQEKYFKSSYESRGQVS